MRLSRVSPFLVLVVTLHAEPPPSTAEQYRETAGRLIGAALSDLTGYQKLTYLCDRIGNRIPGGGGLPQAINWAVAQMRRDGLTNVIASPVKVQTWIRGKESLSLLQPVRRELPILGLGNSVGTAPEGIEAEVVVVPNFNELEKLGRAGVEGKIVLFNAPYVDYSTTVQYRALGASRAAKLGAAAALVRSVASATLRTPHTGALWYAPDAPRIPAAAVTIEDAMMMQRLADSGDRVRIRLKMEAHQGPEVDSANVTGEIPGREKPEEVVVIGGHLDSWDVGQGAQDDASGSVAAMQAAYLIHRSGLQPRRTIRVVLWTDEEKGGAGSRAYRQSIGDQIKNHVAAIEMDGGAERPVGFETPIKDAPALARLRAIAGLLSGIRATNIISGSGEADTTPLETEGVPVMGLRTVMEHYFDWHHTEADTLDKIKPDEFQANVAALAVMAYVLADMPERLR
ncbi:MAG: M20/M25/M40 family metallo-hydrolase [Bryobacteraceae bacterium]